MSTVVPVKPSPQGASPSSPEGPAKASTFCIERALAIVLSAILIGAVLYPIVENWREDPRDNFPLSYYPMFSQQREGPIRVTYIVGHDAEGNEYPVRYSYAGTGGLNQVRKQIRKQVRDGNSETLCRQIAKRVARNSAAPYCDLTTISIVTGEYLTEEYFSGNKTAETRTVEASCRVTRKDAT